jgi:hypothetical protein
MRAEVSQYVPKGDINPTSPALAFPQHADDDIT